MGQDGDKCHMVALDHNCQPIEYVIKLKSSTETQELEFDLKFVK